mmetsp:Transcript_13244/g.28608  ORF Transcript_13244/g.28608 Transcript_13244/m.28608 type:complete len:210 (-) Transcript_13244:297-926(-)
MAKNSAPQRQTHTPNPGEEYARWSRCCESTVSRNPLSQNSEVEVGGCPVARIWVLQIDELDGELDVHSLISRVLLCQSDCLDRDEHCNRPLARHRNLLSVTDAPGDGASELVTVRLLLTSEVVLSGLTPHRLRLLELECDVGSIADVLFKNWLHDESNWRRLLKKILAGNSNRLDRLVDGRWASGHDPRDGAIGITHCIADRARSLLWN